MTSASVAREPARCSNTRLDDKEKQVIILTRWAQKWLKFGWNVAVHGMPIEQLAKKIVNELDEITEEPTYYIDDIVEERTRMVAVKLKHDKSMTLEKDENTTDGQATTKTNISSKEESNIVKQIISRKVSQKIRKRQRSNFSAAVAKLAYNKFGERPMSQANVLVTRKWIQKYLEDLFKDLRTCDKNLAIDRALFLSFVPTKDFLKYRIIMETKEVEKRMTGQTSWWGRVFRIADPSPL